jgi:hypothetical protein
MMTETRTQILWRGIKRGVMVIIDALDAFFATKPTK